MLPRVVVVGGGLTGLATAWRLREHADVVVLEAGDRPGGQIRTIELGGVRLDVGADAFLARQPEGQQLVVDAGLGDALVAPAASTVLLWRRSGLRPLPPATVFGAPSDPWALARSRVLSPFGLLRAAIEPVLPRRHVAGDRSVADLVGERFGREVVEVLVEPLLGGVYAGLTDELSAQATIAPVWAAAQEHRSLTAGLVRTRRAAPADGRPVFQTLRGGLSRLVERLADDLGDRLRVGVAATGLRPIRSGPWAVQADGERVVADHVVLAVPAGPAGRLLAPVVPDAARELAGIRTASVGVIALAYDPADTTTVPDISGVLVPRGTGRRIKAITVGSRKWPHLADGPRFVVRASVGRMGDGSALASPDDELADRVDAEVRWVLGIRAPARERQVVRWNDALPQYDVGHLQRVDRLRHAVAASGLHGLHVAGASLDGVGLAARAREAERLADRIRNAPARRRERSPARDDAR